MGIDSKKYINLDRFNVSRETFKVSNFEYSKMFESIKLYS